MNDVRALVLHGSPGSGKTTLARGVAEHLRLAGLPHAVIDLDELSIVDPHPGRAFGIGNLRAIWPHYAAIARLRVILPTVVADEDELAELRAAAPAATFAVCELTAPEEVLKQRVTAREPNEFWQQRLRDFVDLHHARTDLAAVRDFSVSTHDRAIDDTAAEIVTKAGWAP